MPLFRAGPSPVGVNKWPQPFLNITPLQKRKSETVGGTVILIQSEAVWKLVRDEFFFFLSVFRIQFVTYRFDPSSWPRVVLVERAAGGALSVCKLDDMAIVCVWAYMEAPVAKSVQPVWSLRSGRVVRASLLRRSLSFCPLRSVAMSCLDVMYHQSYGAHYLPAAAYKATYYNHHHQQQQVR